MSQDRDLESARIARLREENSELERELFSLHQFMDALEKLMSALDSPRREEEVFRLLEHVLDNALMAIDASDGSLLVPDEGSGELMFALVRGDSPNESLVGTRLPAGKGVAAWVFRNRRAAIVNNAAADDRFYRHVDAHLDYRTQSLLAAPIIGGGKVLGVVEVLNKRDGKLFSTGNQTLLTVMCRFAGELLYSMLKDIDLSQTTMKIIQASAG